MLQAQGLPPADPYRMLQLHPSAPRELVVDAYWTLAARCRQSDQGPADAASARSKLGELNAAYSVLMDDARRREFAGAYGFAGRPPSIKVRRRTGGIFGLGSSIEATSDHSDYYHLLRLDPEADGEMVDVAYTVLARKAIGYNIEDVFLRDLLDEAHHTLRDPQLRAQYDASLTKNGKHPQAVNGSAPPLTVIPALAADEEPEQEPSSGAFAAELEVAAAALATQDGHNGAAPTKQKRGFLRRQKKAPPVVAAAAAASVVAITADRDDVNAAEHARLLTLRDVEHAELSAPLTHADYRAERPLAELEFVSGPRAGTRVSLGAEAITLGSSYEADVMLASEGGVAPEHGRIWQHGENFVFRQVDGEGTLVGGQELTLPLVMLDDGDEIVIGPHRMLFHQGD